MDIFNKKYKEMEARQLSPITLAFIGDAVFELYVRTGVVEKHPSTKINELHKKVVKYVKASGQSDFANNVIKDLNEDEIYIFKKGRNANSGTVPKNAKISDYRSATGIETLVGYLYIIGQSDRIQEILNKINII